MTVRLTQDMRALIAQKAVNESFRKQTETHAKMENAIGIECYKTVFDEATRRAVAKIPEKWLQEDACLRFNCGGFDLRLTVEKAPRVPSTGYGCRSLGSITGDLADRAQAHAQAGETLKRNKADAQRALLVMLGSVSTIGQLEKTWPEGKPFYEKYLEARPGSNLPAIQVAEINAMLGIEAAA